MSTQTYDVNTVAPVHSSALLCTGVHSGTFIGCMYATTCGLELETNWYVRMHLVRRQSRWEVSDEEGL